MFAVIILSQNLYKALMEKVVLKVYGDTFVVFAACFVRIKVIPHVRDRANIELDRPANI